MIRCRSETCKVRQAGKEIFGEVTRNLQVEWFDVLPEQDGLLPVELDGQPLCRILDSGTVRYWEKDIGSDSRREALERVTDIARVTDEYMSQMDAAPKLKVGSLEGDFRLLAEFNGTVLAGHLTKYGTQFVTWNRSPDGTSLNQGNYYGPDYAAEGYIAAKQNFAVRSGLVTVHTGAVDGGIPQYPGDAGWRQSVQ